MLEEKGASRRPRPRHKQLAAEDGPALRKQGWKRAAKRAMAAAGQQAMTQEELNLALCGACGPDNDLSRVAELLDRGADPNALVDGYNALHMAARLGSLEIVKTLLGRGAVLETRNSWGRSALLWAASFDHLEICLFLIARGADLRVVDYDYRRRSALSHYGCNANNRQGLDPSVKALRVAELKKAWREGCHPSQVQRRKDENWAKRWPLMEAATGCGFLLMAAKKSELKATALPTDAKLPPLPTATEDQRRALRHSKVLGNVGLVRRIASFIPDKERGEEEDEDI